MYYQWESIITNIFNTDSFMLTACACMWVQGKVAPYDVKQNVN